MGDEKGSKERMMEKEVLLLPQWAASLQEQRVAAVQQAIATWEQVKANVTQFVGQAVSVFTEVATRIARGVATFWQRLVRAMGYRTVSPVSRRKVSSRRRAVQQRRTALGLDTAGYVPRDANFEAGYLNLFKFRGSKRYVNKHLNRFRKLLRLLAVRGDAWDSRELERAWKRGQSK